MCLKKNYIKEIEKKGIFFSIKSTSFQIVCDDHVRDCIKDNLYILSIRGTS